MKLKVNVIIKDVFGLKHDESWYPIHPLAATRRSSQSETKARSMKISILNWNSDYNELIQR